MPRPAAVDRHFDAADHAAPVRRGAADLERAAAAALLGVDRTTGTIEAGKEADIVGVPGDVLQNITATERVRFVMKGGRIVRSDR